MTNEIQRLTDMYPDHNFLHSMSDWISDIKVIDQEFGGNRGICLPESRRKVVFCQRHENDVDFCSTLRHEDIHGCCSDEWDENGSYLWDIEHEHIMIRNMSWTEENFNEGDYFSIVNGEHIKPKMSETEYLAMMKKVNKMSDKLEECNVEETK